MIRFVVFLFPIFAFINTVQGRELRGPGVNNGGGGWVCRTPDNTVRWIQLHDLWMRKKILKENKLFSSFVQEKGTAFEIYERKLKWIKSNAPELQFYLDRHPLDIKKSMMFVDRPLDVVHDNFIRAKPSKDECKEGKVYYAQIANFLSNDMLLIDKDIWNSAQFSESDKAALLLHEIIYRALREDFGQASSISTQNIVGDLFERQSLESFNDRLHRNIWEESFNREQNEYALLFPVEIECQISITIYPELLGHQYKNATYPLGKNRFELAGYVFSVQIDPTDEIPQAMAIQHIISGVKSQISYSTIKAPIALSGRAEVTLYTPESHAELFCFSK